MKSTAIPFKVKHAIFEFTKTISSILGLAPCKTEFSACPSKKNISTIKFSFSLLGCAWNCLLKIIFIALPVFVGPHMTASIYPNNSTTIMIITRGLSVIGNLSVVFVISLYTIRQKRVIEIANQLNYFDEKFGAKLFTTNDDVIEEICNIARILVLLIIWCGMYSSTFLLSYTIHLSGTGFCLTFYGWLLIQYSLIINILRRRFKGINEAFLAIFQFPIGFQDNVTFGTISNNPFGVENFFIIKKARNMIYNVSCQVTEFYSIPILTAIFFDCCSFINTSYFYVIGLLSTGGFHVKLINPIFWGLASAYPIIILSRSVNSFQSEMDRTTKILYDVMESYIPNKELESQLNAFAVELMHKKVPFTACGLFSLDCTLLNSIFGMIVTYLLILMQFNPADSL